jgi:hypothetical protein
MYWKILNEADGVHAEMPSLLLQGMCKELLHHSNN